MRTRLIPIGLLAIASCHACWLPGSTPPPSYSRPPSYGLFDVPFEGTLTDDDSEFALGIRYSVQRDGVVTPALQTDHPERRAALNVFTDASTPEATTANGPPTALTIPVLAGDLCVVVSEAWRDAIKTKFTLAATFTPTPT